jgi:hypothetical protein
MYPYATFVDSQMNDTTDRCVSKYLEGQMVVGAVLQKANEAQAQQQQSMQQAQTQMGR